VHYRRGLLINTGVGDDTDLIQKAVEFCEVFNLQLERIEGTLSILEQHLQKAREIDAKTC
jgi:hypothetical protein